MNELLQQELLKTLSFLEPMSLEFIFLDFDKDFLTEHPDLTTDDLLQELEYLTKKKLVSMRKHEGQRFWIKNYPKKPWYKKIRSIFRPFK